VFDGDGFGLGLTVVTLDDPDLPPGFADEVRPRWTDILPPGVRSRAGQAMELNRVQAEKARMFAYEAELICRFADNCPEDAVLVDERIGPDRAPEQREPQISEFFVDELAAALDTSVTSASYTWIAAQTLVQRLPGTWAALADGELDVPRGKAIITEVGRSPSSEPAVLLAVEAAVLPRARELTVTALRAAVRAELVARDAEFAERRRRWAERNADASVRPDPDAPGRADLVAGMSTEDAHACWAVADRIARAAKAAGDPRPLGVLRAQAVRDRILGVEGDTPPITAHVTVIAPLDALEHAARDEAAAPPAAPPSDADEPTPATVDTAIPAQAHPGITDAGDAGSGGATFAIFRPDGRPAPGALGHPGADPTGRRTPIGEVNGQPITHTHLRELLERLDALCPGGLQPPAGGGLAIALTDPDGVLRAVLSRPTLQRLVRRGCPDHPPGGDCGCGLLDRPPPVDRYRPSAAQYAFVRTRDRRCRMPGCTARAAWADLDHVLAHARGGATACENLCCLCRRHHRLKTFARGWTVRMDPDGTYTVTTPSGLTRTTRPPGMHTAGATARGTPAGPAPSGADPAEDPPPF
jgi:hypothetical protein